MRYLTFAVFGLLAACVQQPNATPDSISFDYDPRFWTKTMIDAQAGDHCDKYGKMALLVADVEKNDSSGDRIVTFNCVDKKTGQ